MPVQKTSAATSGRRNKKPAPDQNIFGVNPPCRKRLAPIMSVYGLIPKRLSGSLGIKSFI